MGKKLVVITGTNASGKSGLGIELAKKYSAEIVSADSRQVYKGLDLGSGKVTKEEMQGVPHHLLDVALPNDFFSLVDFQKQAYEAIDDILARDKKAFLVGGTGLYINAVVDGYNIKLQNPDMNLRRELNSRTREELIEIIKEKNPAALEGLDLNNTQRIERTAERALAGDTGKRINTPGYDTLVIGVTWPREVLYERIRERLDRRLDQGMIDEVIRLRAEGATDEFLYGLGLEYRYILMYLRGEFENFDAFYNKLFMEIRHLAKGQMTWFRKRKDIHWIEMDDDPIGESVKLIDEFYGR
ncbi:MAG: tRNA (adenosine(37)-N6)-dimethylallyltransferase MiaA [Lachnospiraceae bacterium]|nr:tRNA (adenosine(37)-N6)-dimethylallyltransferase MiaA [Candidatus Darwinimomas equi]